jgi:hypothetical protein
MWRNEKCLVIAQCAEGKKKLYEEKINGCVWLEVRIRKNIDMNFHLNIVVEKEV